ncbi:septum site-determining protein MinC [Thalassomonas actiniarum]|uniref:Probable septum site-determining protein MinC n=1 Tax=Thalassomonas actiniarum TaxID=485447 RepID=A0AAE9YUX5_9GAMM|nr:septum site-determining protein MinC [Thalassomonas actiniarum]WDE01027.1 septum site-determining protein MinC [Thalassomonas actiniarum]
MADATVEFKGTSFTLSVLHLKTIELSDICRDLEAKIAQAPDFFHLVPLAVNIDQVNSDSEIDYQAIKNLVELLNFNFVGFTGVVAAEQKQHIRELGLSFINAVKTAPRKAAPAKVEKTAGADNAAASDKTEETPAQVPHTSVFSDKVHRGQVRSGQQLYAKDQNLVIIGSVSAGAEVIADGNIHIYGALRGRAIAGAKGHHQAQIYCQNLEAELVSINGNYWLSESMEQDWGYPAYIYLTDTELASSKLV